MSEQEVVPGTMRALLLPPSSPSISLPSSLTYKDTHPTPNPSENQYLIQIQTASLTRHELSLLLVSSRSSSSSKALIPARNFCGVVISTPANDMNRSDGPTFKIGDEVFGLLGLDGEGDGAAADYALAVEDELAFKPRNITAAEAAGVPLAALMAWQALEGAGLRSSLIDEAEAEGEGEDGHEKGAGGGDFIRVLVMGASSEVGRYVVQLLRAGSAPFDGGIRRRKPRGKGGGKHHEGIYWIGAATCSTKEDESRFLRNELGVDAVIPIDGSQEGGSYCEKLSKTFKERGFPPVDVVLDCYEDTPDDKSPDIAISLASSPHIVRRDGGWEVLKLNQPDWSVEMVDVVDSTGHRDTTAAFAAESKNNKSWAFTVRPNSVQLAEIADVIEKGEVKPLLVEREFGLYEGREAMELVEREREDTGGRGKVVLRVNS